VVKSDLVISNTAALNEEFMKRFPKHPGKKFVVLLNGFDPDEFDSPRSVSAERATKFVITHTGFLYGRRDPRLFLEALTVLLERQSIDRDKIQVFLVGSVKFDV